MPVDHLCPGRTAELVARLAEQQQGLPGFAADPRWDTAADVVEHAEHADHRCWQDRRFPRLVEEAHVAAGHRDAELRAAVGEPVHGPLELPHHARVGGRAEVQAVGHRERLCAAGRHIAVGLGERELRTRIGVEVDEPGVAVGGHRHAAAGFLVDPDQARVRRLGKHRVAAHVAVVLLGDPFLGRLVRRGDHAQQGFP